jgi:scyllo-inositol 2-dehydrogenase (NADP+)
VSPTPVNVGIICQGRSGWGIHAATLRTLPELYHIAAVTDLEQDRLDEARQELDCAVYRSYLELLRDPTVELVIVASPSYLHAPYSIAALQAGKAVVCEKPMAPTLANADSMIAAAERTGCLLTVFHNRRYDPSYLKVKEVIESGVLGRIVEIKLNLHDFGRRWDWQTVQGFGGGQLRNNGVHYIDQALHLMGPCEPEVICFRENVLSLGDAEDHVKVIMHAPGAPLATVEVSSATAYPQEHWLVLGTQGSLAGSVESLRWKYFLPEEMPERALSVEPTTGRTYNSEKIPFHEETWTGDASFLPMGVAFYLDLYRTLREGAPLAVSLESARRVMQIVEQCG